MLKDKKALVTGGTRGIGYAIAEILIKNGADVLVTGTRQGGSGPKGSQYIQADFSQSIHIENLLKQCKAYKPDILINNAAGYHPSNFEEATAKQARLVHEVTFLAPFQLSQAAIPHMKNNRWGRIINIGTLWTSMVSKERSAYIGSKMALIGLTRNLSSDYAAYNILSNMISPGFTETDWSKKISKERKTALEKSIPLERLASPEEIAKAVLWFASPENTYITGQNIFVDGGYTKNNKPF